MASNKRNRVDGQLSKEAYEAQEYDSEEQPGVFSKATPGTLASRRMVSSKVVNKKSEFIRHISALNVSFFEWFQSQYEADKHADMRDGVQDYIDYVNQLQDRYLKEYGEVLTFGSGDCGQLAHGVEEDEDLMVKFPRIVYSLRDKRVCGISCGGIHNAVFTDDGLVYTWGCSDDGSLGRPGDEATPLLVEGLDSETIIGVACGDGQTIAVSTSGSVWGWGCYKDKEGKKWFNPSETALVQHKDIKKQQNTPIRIQGISGAVDIACGSVCNLARCDDGQLYSWGLGECGELARAVPPLRKDGEYDLEGMLKHHLTPGPMYTSESSKTPVRNAKSIGCGSYHCFVVVVTESAGMEVISDDAHSGATVLTCGLNNYGQLGLGEDNTTNMSYLTEIPSLQEKGVVSLQGGAHHSLALTSSGQVYAFGRGDSGQLGVKAMSKNTAGDFSSVPLEVDLGDMKVVSIACGANHNLAVTSGNEIYSWGYGDMLALGHGKEKDESVPKRMNFDHSKIDRINVTQVSGGGQHSAVIGSVLTTI